MGTEMIGSSLGARFEQEARAAAALNHPHIAVVHSARADSVMTTGPEGSVAHSGSANVRSALPAAMAMNCRPSLRYVIGFA